MKPTQKSYHSKQQDCKHLFREYKTIRRNDTYNSSVHECVYEWMS